MSLDILPRQSQIWAVLRKNDTAQRLAYSLAATFLGRMCLSGEVHDLSPAQWKLSVSAMELPSAIIPTESNYLLNPAHRDFQKIIIRKPVAFSFDPRLL